jgi:DNA-binding NtrC family response regulator
MNSLENSPLDLRSRLQEYERSLIRDALAQHRGNQRRAAASLGLLPTTLHEKMKRLGLKSASRELESAATVSEPRR